MREGVGSVVLYNIIIVFIVITFGFLMATISYVKAFKVNSKIASAIEKYEGYNSLSDKEILQSLQTIGYQTAVEGTYNCPSRIHFHDGKIKSYKAEVGAGYKNHRYCIYEYDSKNGYITYGIVTYVFIDIPLVGGKFRLPVYSETDAIFEFSA